MVIFVKILKLRLIRKVQKQKRHKDTKTQRITKNLSFNDLSLVKLCALVPPI